MLEAVLGAFLYALGVITGAFLYYRSRSDLSPFPVVSLPKPKLKVRPAVRDEELE